MQCNVTKSMDEDNINISFTDFESVSINTLKALWKDEDFTDVTLATSDGRRQLKAHKVVLSSASDLFNTILREHKHQNPLIFLHGIHLGMLEQILEFIYTGRCEIQEENLKMFLSCGRTLGIQRLAGYTESEDETLKSEKNKTELLSEASINPGTILSLEKGADKDNSEKMGHLHKGYVGTTHIKTTDSVDLPDKLDKCANVNENLQIGTVEAAQFKTGSEDKTVSNSSTWPSISHCKSCDKTFRSKQKLKRHMRYHEKPRVENYQTTKRFLCTICDYKTNRRVNFTDHEGWHAGKVFKCNQCDSVAKSRETLKAHIKYMHGVPFSCTKCEYKSKFRNTMNNHRETMHEDITYKCDQCDFDTTNRYSLGKHKRRVHVTRIKCNICSFGSKCKTTLKWHQQAIHEGLRIKCDLCDKTFNNPRQLSAHKNAHHTQHRQKREYACNECEFTANQKAQLFRHSELAHGTIEHLCEKCPYKTKVENDLKIHINREHLGLYNFQCEQCSYSSKQKTHLDIHTKSKHKGESLMCNLCNYKASQSSNLKRHQITKHRLANSE